MQSGKCHHFKKNASYSLQIDPVYLRLLFSNCLVEKDNYVTEIILSKIIVDDFSDNLSGENAKKYKCNNLYKKTPIIKEGILLNSDIINAERLPVFLSASIRGGWMRQMRFQCLKKTKNKHNIHHSSNIHLMEVFLIAIFINSKNTMGIP